MTIVLGIHNLVRWVVLITAVFALYRMVRGLMTKSAWEKPDRLAGMLFTSALDLQLLLGLMLYFIFSPVVKSFITNFSTAIQNPALRYWGFDHVGLMIAAVALGHIGSAAAKKDLPDSDKFKRSLLFFTLALICLLVGIPWSRPLLPAF